MIKDLETAREAARQLNEAHGMLMQTLGFVQQKCPDEEFKPFLSGMAQVLGRIFFLLLNPILQPASQHCSSRGASVVSGGVEEGG